MKEMIWAIFFKTSQNLKLIVSTFKYIQTVKWPSLTYRFAAISFILLIEDDNNKYNLITSIGPNTF